MPENTTPMQKSRGRATAHAGARGPLVFDLRELGRRYGCADRLIYVHDLHLPTLLKHARGVVTMNSTVGTSALFHRAPVKVMGRAIYDIPGLTTQAPLDQFFQSPDQVDHELYEQFMRWLRANNQVNGSFYKRVRAIGTVSGLDATTFGFRARVETAITELGFRRNTLAEALSVGRSNLVGLLVPDSSNAFFGELAREIEHEARRRSLLTLLGNTEYDPEVERVYHGLVERFVSATSERIEADLAAGRVAGLDAAPTAAALIWMTERYFLMTLGRLPKEPVETVVETLATIWTRTLYANAT